MKRRLFAILSVLSLVLSVTTAGLWVHGYWAGGRLGWCVVRERSPAWVVDAYSVESRTGTLWFELWHDRLAPGQQWGQGDLWWGDHSWSWTSWSPPGWATYGETSFWGRLGFKAGSTASASDPTGLIRQISRNWIVVPCWLVCGLAALLPAWWLYQGLRVRRRLRAGLCRRCGYDLRASRERCPECGAPIPDQVASSDGKA